MGLEIGVVVQFCVSILDSGSGKGLIVATDTVDSYCPEPLENPLDPQFPTCVKIKNVRWLDDKKPCPFYILNPRRGSHRLGDKGPC